MFPKQSSGDAPTRRNADKTRNAYGKFKFHECPPGRPSSSGSASRFFPHCPLEEDDYLPLVYAAKASGRDRGNRTEKALPLFGIEAEEIRNFHATVKPLTLMRWLLTLVRQPERNLILDPFAGSGTTLVAAKQLGLPCVGIELSPEFAEIAVKRVESAKTRVDAGDKTG